MEFPHHYVVSAACGPEGTVSLSGEGLPRIASLPPKAFGGPGDQWSPEDLLVAAVADCFCLSFRAIAQASKFAFRTLDCRVSGTLDRVERVMQFTEMKIEARLSLDPGGDPERARRLLEKAEQMCLITNSLKCSVHLDTQVNGN